MSIKFIVSVVFALFGFTTSFTPSSTMLRTKLASENLVVSKDRKNVLSQNSPDENQAYFQPRDWEEDQKYRGRMVGEGTFAGGCPNTQPPRLTAFVPGDGTVSVRSTTAKLDPTFWFYIPPTPSYSKLPAEFELKDESQSLWRQKYQPLQKTGLFRIQIPQQFKNGESLSQDKNYRWRFRIICDPQARANAENTLSVYGTVKLAALPTSPPEMSPKDQARYYLQNGLWHEGLTTYIEKVCPQDAQYAKKIIQLVLSSNYVNFKSNDVERYVKTIIEYCNPNNL